jgi:peptidyl-prolyl cis-trans isomerase C
MKNKVNKSCLVISFLFVLVLVSGCGNNDKNKKESSAPAVSGSLTSSNTPNVIAEQAVIPGAAVSVDGEILKKSDLENSVKDRMKMFKDKIPADKQKEFQENVKKRLVDEFIMRTLLNNEMAKRKIEVSDKEIKIAKDKIQASLPPNKKVDEFLKENRISQEDIILGIKVEKFMNEDIGNKAKPSQKEISKFYNDNRNKLFVVPESVHVRHILVSVSKDDNEKIKAEKKAKIENIRKQLLNGGDFAELARKNSDCPSKEAGGDLNFIKRGQTVKTFEDAAFSQEKNIIGPVINTEFGYHVIQVLDRKPAKTIALGEIKDRISAFLEQQNKSKAFADILKKLQQNAKIAIYQ